MKLITYLKYRELFEEQYKKCILERKDFLGLVNIYHIINEIKIYNFKLFINIYSFDKRCTYSNIVSSIDKRKRFKIIKENNYPALKIKIENFNLSLVDNNSEEYYDKIFKYIKSKT